MIYLSRDFAFDMRRGKYAPGPISPCLATDIADVATVTTLTCLGCLASRTAQDQRERARVQATSRKSLLNETKLTPPGPHSLSTMPGYVPIAVHSFASKKCLELAFTISLSGS